MSDRPRGSICDACSRQRFIPRLQGLGRKWTKGNEFVKEIVADIIGRPQTSLGTLARWSPSSFPPGTDTGTWILCLCYVAPKTEVGYTAAPYCHDNSLHPWPSWNASDFQINVVPRAPQWWTATVCVKMWSKQRNSSPFILSVIARYWLSGCCGCQGQGLYSHGVCPEHAGKKP